MLSPEDGGSAPQCERYIRARGGERCSHAACVSLTGACVHEHVSTVLLCFCCALAARFTRMACASGNCGAPVTIASAAALAPGEPDNDVLIG